MRMRANSETVNFELGTAQAEIYGKSQTDRTTKSIDGKSNSMVQNCWQTKIDTKIYKIDGQNRSMKTGWPKLIDANWMDEIDRSLKLVDKVN